MKIGLIGAGRMGTALGGRLLEGCPYLAMELCSGGTLSGVGGRWPWARVRDALVAILDALAHAHEGAFITGER